jgi:hypothetical protein
VLFDASSNRVISFMLSSFVGGREIAAFHATGGNARLLNCTVMAVSASRRSACHLQELKSPCYGQAKKGQLFADFKKGRINRNKKQDSNGENAERHWLFCEEGFKRTAIRSAKAKGKEIKGRCAPSESRKMTVSSGARPSAIFLDSFTSA